MRCKLTILFHNQLATMYNHFTPNHKITSLPSNWIFVFGSNLEGRHVAGAAKDAVQFFGAKWGQGEGLQGQSYAIPTMHGGTKEIKPYVDRFLSFAKTHQEMEFVVTPIGCGIARLPLSEIAVLFTDALKLVNVFLPRSFVLAIYAVEALKFGKESHFIDKNESFPFDAFSEMERADIICTDHCRIYTIIKKGKKYGLFEYDDPLACYGEELKLYSVGPTFGYDEIRFFDTRNGYEQQGFFMNYDGYVALNEKGHWSVLALDCDEPITFLCAGDSFQEVADKVANLTLLRHINWFNPIKIRQAYLERINDNPPTLE